jgi:hypothetical protein
MTYLLRSFLLAAPESLPEKITAGKTVCMVLATGEFTKTEMPAAFADLTHA